MTLIKFYAVLRSCKCYFLSSFYGNTYIACIQSLTEYLRIFYILACLPFSSGVIEPDYYHQKLKVRGASPVAERIKNQDSIENKEMSGKSLKSSVVLCPVSMKGLIYLILQIVLDIFCKGF